MVYADRAAKLQISEPSLREVAMTRILVADDHQVPVDTCSRPMRTTT